MRTPTSLAALLLAALFALAPRPADACSIALLLSGPFEPTQAAEAIPRNAAIWLSAGVNARGTVVIGEVQHEMVFEGGAQVAAPELTPGPLVYEITSPDLPDARLGPVAVEVLDVFDEAAPTLPDVDPRVEVERFDEVGNSCGPGTTGRFIHVRPARADDDFGVAGYRVERVVDGEVVGERVAVGANPSVHTFFVPDEQPAIGTFRVTAFDLAGNLSAPRPFDLNLDGDDDPTTEPGGCSAAGSSTPLIALLALAGLALARRRRG